MVSLEGLTKVVDPSQLTPEFDGCLEYNHEEWIEIRLAFEDYISSATHMLSRLEELQDILAKKELPQDLEGARSMIEEHSQLKKKVIKAPIEDLDLEGQKLLQRIQSSDSFPKKNSGSGNADLQSLLPKVSAMLDRLHSTRQHLHQMWHVRKLKLDQCFQLRLFEQDAEKVADGAGGATVLPGGRLPGSLGLSTRGRFGQEKGREERAGEGRATHMAWVRGQQCQFRALPSVCFPASLIASAGLF